MMKEFFQKFFRDLLEEGSHDLYNERQLRLKNMRQANLARLAFFLCGGTILLTLIDETNLWRHADSRRLFYSLYGFYIFTLILFNQLSRHFPERIGPLSNGICDAVLLLAGGILLTRSDTWNMLAVILFASAVLTARTLDNREGRRFALTFGLMLFCSYFLDVYLDYKFIIKYKVGYLGTLTSQLGRFFEVVFISSGEVLMLIMVSRLSNQTRESRWEARQNSRKAERLQALNNAILENISTALLVVDKEANILTMNRSASQLLNAASYEHDDKLIKLSSALAKRFGKWQEMKLQNPQPLEFSGDEYNVQFNQLGGADQVLIQLESVLESMKRVRETRLQALGRLSASIAHEVRNPLSIINGSADLILENLEEPALIENMAGRITKNSGRINNIIGNMLEFFKRGPVQSEALQLNNFLREVAEEARLNQLLASAYIRLELQETEKYLVYFDRVQLRQVVDNLLTNCVRHCGRDDPIITIYTRRGLGERTLYLDISDNGVGVAPADEDRIFEPFYSSQKSVGHGLGLYLVRELCLANQAQINYLRQPVGACFRVAMECFLDDNAAGVA